MAGKLSDHSIDDLRAMLLATEISVGRDSQSARIIRRELAYKLRTLAVDPRSVNAALIERAAGLHTPPEVQL